MLDLLVVGAGPAGLNTARLAALAGLDVAVVEEHKRIGAPRHCSGLISTRLAELVAIKKNFVEHEVCAAVLHSPRGRTLRVEKPGTAAYVINREKFDAHLARVARRAGVKIHTRTAATGLQRVKNGIVLETPRGAFASRLLCGADGPNSFVAGAIGCKRPQLLQGAIAIARERDYSDTVDIHFDNRRYRGFFAWRIPRGRTTEYGCAGELGTDVAGAFKKFVAAHCTTRHDVYGGLIPTGLQRSYGERVLLVGDAAAQVKPLTGGGVIYGMLCSRLAAYFASEAVAKNEYGAAFLKNYETAWRSQIGNEIMLASAARRAYSYIPNWLTEMLFRFADNRRISESLSRGDMDFPVRSLFLRGLTAAT